MVNKISTFWYFNNIFFLISVWVFYPVFRAYRSSRDRHGPPVPGGERPFEHSRQPIIVDRRRHTLWVRVSDADITFSEGDTESKLCDPTSNTVCIWHCQGNKAISCTLSIVIFYCDSLLSIFACCWCLQLPFYY